MSISSRRTLISTSGLSVFVQLYFFSAGRQSRTKVGQYDGVKEQEKITITRIVVLAFNTLYKTSVRLRLALTARMF